MADIYSTPEYLSRQREYRKRTGNASTKRYEKTKRGFIMRAYRNILGRVTGLQPKCRHIYTGLPALSKQDFYDWALAQPEFHKLWDEWSSAGYPRRLTPSVDRIDTADGYVVGNIRWVPMWENSRDARLTTVTVEGVTLTADDWSSCSGVHPQTIRNRIKRGWPTVDAVFIPVLPNSLRRIYQRRRGWA